jgi:hypothetical protein
MKHYAMKTFGRVDVYIHLFLALALDTGGVSFMPQLLYPHQISIE